MRRLVGAFVFAILSSAAQAQTMPCDAFVKNPDGSWSATRNISVPGGGGYFNVREGAQFRPGASFLGIDLAEKLDAQCPAEAAAATAPPQVELPKLADASGLIDADKLTCGQLASTYQEDADFLLAWTIGWRSGFAKKPAIDVPKVKAGIHDVIVYCKANKDKRLVQAIDLILK